MYVIRSMSTTDHNPRLGLVAKPYHIYLLPAEERRGAYWASKLRAALFATAAAAEAEAAALKLTGFQVVPADDRHLPAYWER